VRDDLAFEVRRARQLPYPPAYATLAAYLRSLGFNVNDYQLRDHFLRHETR
jgi:hypothetical protein